MIAGHRPPFAVPTEPPIHELNTTPLIDVMLVLLIIMIISIPAMSHKVMLRLPKVGPPATSVEPVVHRLVLDASGRLFLDGAPIAMRNLPARLAVIRDAPNDVLAVSASGEARYEDYDRLLAVVKRAGVERMGLVGNEDFVRYLDQ